MKLVADRFKQITEGGNEGYEQLAIMYMLLQKKMAELARRAAIFEKRYEIMKAENFKDGLTGIPNNNGYLNFISELKKLDIDSPITVVFVDMDDLKKYNDDPEKGHSWGDEGIKRVAKALDDTIRKDDFVFRKGGDEFCLLLYDADEKTAQSVMDRASSEMVGINEERNSKTIFKMNIEFSYAFQMVEKDKELDVAIEEAKGKADNRMQEKKKERRLLYEK